MTKRRPLWQCPLCGHRFVSRNLSHSCGNYRLADHFKGRSPIVRRLFDKWRAMARACGPVTVYAQKTRIVLQAGVRFAGAVAHQDWLEATVWLRRRASHRCLHRVESLAQLGYNLHLRLVDPADLDDDLRSLMREAYAEHASRDAAPQPAPNKRLQPSAASAIMKCRG